MSLSVAMIVKDAQATLERALESVRFADEVVIVDNQSRDKTRDIANNFTETVIESDEESFAARRNAALEHCSSDWVFFLDADEEVTPELKQELMEITSEPVLPVNDIVAYQVTRDNYFLGEQMYADVVGRLFFKANLTGFEGKVHEHAVYTGRQGRLHHTIKHYTHADIGSMLNKTNRWSEIEAELLVKAGHPPMIGWRLFRMAVTEAWHQFGRLRVGRFGRAGVFEGVFQIIDTLIVYVKLWERQRSKV